MAGLGFEGHLALVDQDRELGQLLAVLALVGGVGAELVAGQARVAALA